MCRHRILLVSAFCSLLAMAQPPQRKASELAFQVPGQGERLLSSYRGKVVSVEFIHTTCVHCQQAARVKEKLQAGYGARGFQAIDIAINPNADLLAENFKKDFGLNFIVGWMNQAQAMAFLGFADSGRYLIPQIVVLDRNGYIRAQSSLNGDDEQADSIRSEQTLTALIRSLLNEAPHRPRRPAK